VIVALSDFSGVVYTKNTWHLFRVKTPFSNFSCVVCTGPYWNNLCTAKRVQFVPFPVWIITQKVPPVCKHGVICTKKWPLYFVLIHREAIKEAVKERMRVGNRRREAKRSTFHELNNQRVQTRPPFVGQFNKTFNSRGLYTNLPHYLSIAVTSVQTCLVTIYRSRVQWSLSLIKYYAIRKLWSLQCLNF